MSSINDLNPAGQAYLACLVTLNVNLIVHPLCTIKTRLMAKSTPTKISGLYAGFGSACMTEVIYNAASYVANDHFERRQLSPFVSSTLAGIAATPLNSFGEAFMVNRQLGNSSMIDTLRKAVGINGLVSTLFRDVPYTVSVLAGAPAIDQMLPISNMLMRNVTSGFTSGSIAGLLTTHCDFIKTRVQGEGLTFFQAISSLRAELKTPSGLNDFYKAAAFRSGYIGLTVALMHVFNNVLPHFFPSRLKKD